jgi:hypothetical protein
MVAARIREAIWDFGSETITFFDYIEKRAAFLLNCKQVIDLIDALLI